MNPKIQIRYHVFGKNWKFEPLRLTFFHPDFDKADLSSIKNVVTLKFRLFSNGKELDTEKIRIKKHSLGCYVCCYSDMTKKDNYNKVNIVNMVTFNYAESLPNGLDKNLHCMAIDSMLRDPIVFLYVENHSPNTIDDGFIEISDTENFEIIKVEDSQLLYVGSKIDPPIERIKYIPQNFDFERITNSHAITKVIKIGEFIESFRLYYEEKKDNGIIINHSTNISVKEINKYKNKVPKNIDETKGQWYTNLYSNDEENEEMLKKLENEEVIKVRDINEKEIEELIKYYMIREDLTREKSIKKVRNNKFMSNLPIFDKINPNEKSPEYVDNENSKFPSEENVYIYGDLPKEYQKKIDYIVTEHKEFLQR